MHDTPIHSMKIGRLSVISENCEGRNVFPIKGLSVYEVGRAAGSHVRIRHESVAMNHCRLYRKDDEFTFYALSEQRPSAVNGEQTRKTVLNSGDRIRLGDVELVFELFENDEEAASAPPPAQAAPASAPPPAQAAPASAPPPAQAPVEQREAPRDQPPEHAPRSFPAKAAAAGRAASERDPPAAPPTAEKAPRSEQPTQRYTPRTAPKPQQTRSARLVVIEGENRGSVYPLTGIQRLKIGRAAGSDVRLPDVKVSRDHCLVEQIEGHYVVVDLESANGTIVNGERIRKTVLQNNDFLRLGFTILKFETAC